MTVKEHYDHHLAPVYSWMAGDFYEKTGDFKQFLKDQLIQPQSTKIAIDLGAGHGIQSIPLAEMGFQVIAVDFNEQLLEELKLHAHGLPIVTIQDDLKKVATFAKDPELIVCCGDTLTHLANRDEVEEFLRNAADALVNHGRLVLSFRDYSQPLTGLNRIIPVKSDANRILTCILDFETDFVTVTDLLHEKSTAGWIQKVSSYQKVRLSPDEVLSLLEEKGMTIQFNEPVNRLVTIVATKNA